MKPNYKYGLYDSISGNRIIGWAGKIFAKNSIYKKGILLKTLEFFLGTECIVLEPITINKPSIVKDIVPEGLIGRKIHGEAEGYSRFKKVKKTAPHRHWETVLKDNAYCVINIPIKSRQHLS